jgi:hypothetical protein
MISLVGRPAPTARPSTASDGAIAVGTANVRRAWRYVRPRGLGEQLRAVAEQDVFLRHASCFFSHLAVNKAASAAARTAPPKQAGPSRQTDFGSQLSGAPGSQWRLSRRRQPGLVPFGLGAGAHECSLRYVLVLGDADHREPCEREPARERQVLDGRQREHETRDDRPAADKRRHDPSREGHGVRAVREADLGRHCECPDAYRERETSRARWRERGCGDD